MTGTLLYASAVGICVGVALALFFTIPLWVIGCILGAAFLFALRHSSKALFMALICAALCVGAVRTQYFLQAEKAESFSGFVGNKKELTGRVVADPEKRDASLHAVLDVQRVGGGVAHGTVLVLLARDAQVSYGDLLTVQGNIVLPKAFATDTGREFAYPEYLRAQGVSVVVQKGVVVSRTPAGTSLLGALFSIKHHFERALERVVPEPQVSLLEGILLGERRGIPKDTQHAFIVSGLVHVVVLSGYNMSVVSDALFRVLAFLPHLARYSLGAAGVVLFALFAGAGATTVRACLMGLIAILARSLNRTAVALRSLAAATAAMVFWNPLILLCDPSFQLSVLATFGLVTLSPWVDTWVPKKPQNFPAIASIVSSTIAVQLFVLPALLYYSGVVSFVALPANVLVLPVIPLTMLLGAMAGVGALLLPALGFLPGVFADLLLRYMLFVAETIASLPGAAFVAPPIPAFLVCFFYIPLTLFAIGRYRRSTL